MIEIIAGILAGKTLSTKILHHGSTQGGFLSLVLDSAKFIDMNEYLTLVDELVKEVKSCPPAKGFSEVLLPGEPEDRVYEQRIAHGIPLDEDIWNSILDIAKSKGIEV
ncbi:MAG: Ldh family oxidoreductase [Ignisphaera sp.]